jgi:hypothetical protein
MRLDSGLSASHESCMLVLIGMYTYIYIYVSRYRYISLSPLYISLNYHTCFTPTSLIPPLFPFPTSSPILFRPLPPTTFAAQTISGLWVPKQAACICVCGCVWCVCRWRTRGAQESSTASLEMQLPFKDTIFVFNGRHGILIHTPTNSVGTQRFSAFDMSVLL